MLIDMINMILIENNSNFKVIQGEPEECFTNLKQMRHYSNTESIYNIKISLDEINIILSNYSNPQVRSSFYIENGILLSNSIGPIVRPINSSEFIISNLNNIESLENIKENYKSEKSVTEYYIDDKGNENIKNISLY